MRKNDDKRRSKHILMLKIAFCEFRNSKMKGVKYKQLVTCRVFREQKRSSGFYSVFYSVFLIFTSLILWFGVNSEWTILFLWLLWGKVATPSHSFSSKRRLVFIKTTCCFQPNDVLFSPKRRVVFTKTTCCFHQNDVLFSLKRRLVCN